MVTDKEILEAFDSIYGPYVTATELEEVLPIGRHAINKRLKKLEEEGEVRRKQPVKQSVGWWRPENYDPPELPDAYEVRSV